MVRVPVQIEVNKTEGLGAADMGGFGAALHSVQSKTVRKRRGRELEEGNIASWRPVKRFSRFDRMQFPSFSELQSSFAGLALGALPGDGSFAGAIRAVFATVLPRAIARPELAVSVPE